MMAIYIVQKPNKKVFAVLTPGDKVSMLLLEMMAGCQLFTQLWTVVKEVLLITHGQASFEQGLSVNKHVDADTLIGSTFEAKRLKCGRTVAVGGM